MMSEHSTLAEARFYVLMALSCGEKSKVEVLDYVYNHSCARVSVWPGMLCTILDELGESGMIRAVSADPRRPVYALTERGHSAYDAALRRLFDYVGDAIRAAVPEADDAACTAV